MSENKILKETEKEFKKFADKVIHRAKFYLKRRKKNTKNKTLSDSLDYNLKLYSSGALELGFTAAEHFNYVEQGRKPGKMPPSTAIANWIKIKPLRIRGADGRFIEKNKKNINNAAFAIAKSIEMYGIKPTYFFRDAFKMHYKRIDKTILKAYAKDMEKFLKTTLKDNIKTE
tara:strand:- start:555 stop:1070 length:516 start_codon:yes stop_codon:yes gene_type:complete